jgi:hypothetical protein
MKRVQEVNSNPHFLIRIVNVVVFGSYLRGATDLGDLDLAYDWKPKIEDRAEYKRASIAQFKASGRPDDCWSFASQGWPEEEVRLFLKNKQRTYSLLSLHRFFEMDKIETFSYRVLLGDSEYIRIQLLGTPSS